jgi:hypothetical protein
MMVGAEQHRLRNGDAQSFGGFEIDDQLIAGRLLGRQRLCPARDSVRVKRGAATVFPFFIL